MARQSSVTINENQIMPKGISKNGINRGWFLKGRKPNNDLRKAINCLKCNSVFLASPSAERMFCSQRCGHLGKKSPNYWLGKKMSEEHIQKLSDAHKGEKAYQWIEDRTKLKRFNDDAKDRRSYAYQEWRRRVWIRDNYKCKIANQECKGRLEAHHILGYAEHPELRYDINNGITLCHFHHPRKRENEKELSPYFQKLVAEMN